MTRKTEDRAVRSPRQLDRGARQVSAAIVAQRGIDASRAHRGWIVADPVAATADRFAYLKRSHD